MKTSQMYAELTRDQRAALGRLVSDCALVSYQDNGHQILPMAATGPGWRRVSRRLAGGHPGEQIVRLFCLCRQFGDLVVFDSELALRTASGVILKTGMGPVAAACSQQPVAERLAAMFAGFFEVTDGMTSLPSSLFGKRLKLSCDSRDLTLTYVLGGGSPQSLHDCSTTYEAAFPSPEVDQRTLVIGQLWGLYAELWDHGGRRWGSSAQRVMRGLAGDEDAASYSRKVNQVITTLQRH